MKLIYICEKDVSELPKWQDWGCERGFAEILTGHLNGYISKESWHKIYITVYSLYCYMFNKYSLCEYIRINMQSYLNTLHRIWVTCVYRGYMWDKYVLWATVNDMAALYGGSHDGSKNITPHYGRDRSALRFASGTTNLIDNSCNYINII